MSKQDEDNSPVQLHDYKGNPIKMGGDPDDPMILGADSHVASFRLRDRSSYPNYPSALFEIEQDWFLPLATHLAGFCQVDLLDERTYKKLIPALRQTRLCAVISLQDVTLSNGFATWDAFVIYAKDFPVVKVTLHAKLDPKLCGIPKIMLWRRAEQAYSIVGSALINGPVIERNVVYNVVTTYLEREIFSVKKNLKPGELA